MNLAQIKEELGIPTFQLNTALDADGNKTDWMRHWDNDNRMAISIHKDTLARLKADTNNEIDSIVIQTSEKEGPQGIYIANRLVIVTPAEETL